jgi:hypothetical protein
MIANSRCSKLCLSLLLHLSHSTHFFFDLVQANKPNILTYITADRLRQAERATDWRKLTCNLLMAMFPAEDLQTKSVTGRTSKGSSRQALDVHRVDAIIGT